MLTEVGRQPWIVQGLLKTSNANSPSVTTTWLGISLGVFIALYLALLVVDVWLMRRYAGVDPAAPEEQAARRRDAGSRLLMEPRRCSGSS